MKSLKFIKEGRHVEIKRQIKSFLMRNNYSYEWLAEKLDMAISSVRQYMCQSSRIPSDRQSQIMLLMREYDKDTVHHYEMEIIEAKQEAKQAVSDIEVPICIDLPVDIVMKYSMLAKEQGKMLKDVLREKLV